ncbi:hypothetical protein [Arcobacter cloacae]|uniref:Uncharacterized protein n=1 Tax=Arcobacter cloacae TaxID=1054034 RepID=A0A4Q0ZH45_9BACT|nr:putative membrane protein [Arcobacter cloacae]RXI42171.1 hypothetical protein CP963_03770 [Arcobacter cloacae]RXJ82946.1 hypothetical protein CRU90_11930 [Arcobacter cloacae]
MENEHKKSFVEKTFLKVSSIDRVLEDRIDFILLRIITMLKYFFILAMILYLAICIMSLSHKIISFTLAQGALDFASIKNILTDGLFTLIVIAIVKTLFIKNGFDYALTFLEIAFVVIIRKLILLETIPSETDLLIALGVTSSLFFILIIYIHNLKRKWLKEDK